jgi:hypothetical protein
MKPVLKTGRDSLMQRGSACCAGAEQGRRAGLQARSERPAFGSAETDAGSLTKNPGGCPLLIALRTQLGHQAMSEMCQTATSAVQRQAAIRRGTSAFLRRRGDLLILLLDKELHRLKACPTLKYIGRQIDTGERGLS